MNLHNVAVKALDENEDSYVIHAQSVVAVRDCPEWVFCEMEKLAYE